MRKIIDISIESIKPDSTAVFKTQGIPPGKTPIEQVRSLYHSAEELFLNLAAPIGIMAGISIREFGEIFQGKGMNEKDTPLEHIYPRADNLALFAFTLGPEVGREIEEQSKTDGLALGYMLDAVASYSTDKASDAAAEIYFNHLSSKGEATVLTRVLPYSPGYCGWHISGQQKLFEYLKPEEIGIRLNKSFLMVPLKSVSGVLVAGNADIHKFKNNYPFCSQCKTRSCRERFKKLRTP
jgi:hypothetical protein